MKEIAENVWHIDDIGSSVNVYLWRWDGHLALIDTGLPWHGKKILNAIKEAGFNPEDIKEILITHADTDHAGGLRVIREATGARVVVHAIEAMFFKGKWHRWPNFRHPLGVLITPLYFLLSRTVLRLPRLQPDLLVVDTEVLDNGLQVIHTPGHTPGHMSLYHKETGVLFVGDVISHRRGKLALPPAVFTPQPEIVRDSLRKLGRLKNVQVACFGHGPVLTDRAGERLRAFIARTAPPPKRARRPRVATRPGVPRQPKAQVEPPTSESPSVDIELKPK